MISGAAATGSLDALGAVQGVRLAADARERVDDVALYARQLRYRLPHVVSDHHVGEVAVAREVGDPSRILSLRIRLYSLAYFSVSGSDA